MFLLVVSYFGAKVSLEDGKVAPLQACDDLELFQELYNPVARIISHLILDVVAAITVPNAHANVLRDNVKCVSGAQAKVNGQRLDEAHDQILGSVAKGFETTHGVL